MWADTIKIGGIIINRVILIGRWAKENELRYSASGVAYLKNSIAVNKPFSKEKEADFFEIAMFNKIAENTTNYTKKGTLVAVEGRLQQEKWTTEDGQNRSKVVVIADNIEFLEWGDKEKQSPAKKDNDFGSVDIDMSEFQAMNDDEDIPF